METSDMTAAQREYCAAVEECCARNGYDIISPGGDEASFSSHPCECCGTAMAGDRQAADACFRRDGDFQTHEIEICTDCVLYLANGEIPERPFE